MSPAVALLGLWLAASPGLLFWGRPAAADYAALQARQAEVGRLLAWYTYAYAHWNVHELQTPLIQRHHIYKLLARDSNGRVSEAVVVLANDGGAARLIPLQVAGLGPELNELDPHNIAIFNALVEDEPALPPHTSSDWLELAELYLNLAGDLPQIVTAERHSLAPHIPLPRVSAIAPAGAVVEFTDYEGQKVLIHWRMEFDAAARLRHLNRTQLEEK